MADDFWDSYDFWQTLQVVVPFIPIAGAFQLGAEIRTGEKLFTGEKLTTTDKVMNYVELAAIAGQLLTLAYGMSAAGQAAAHIQQTAREVYDAEMAAKNGIMIMTREGYGVPLIHLPSRELKESLQIARDLSPFPGSLVSTASDVTRTAAELDDVLDAVEQIIDWMSALDVDPDDDQQPDPTDVTDGTGISSPADPVPPADVTDGTGITSSADDPEDGGQTSTDDDPEDGGRSGTDGDDPEDGGETGSPPPVQDTGRDDTDDVD